jgi:thioredoxin-like negative regulator of GroEL
MIASHRPSRRSTASPLATAAAVALMTAVVLAGCRPSSSAAPEGDAAPPAGAEKAAPADLIPWFQGSVEEAFALAKAERRPVFLYWGAVWCPPCHALRTKLFTRPEFQARLAATVPVYLDGDTARAQIWGEKLGTQGYPTVIVFDAEGREVTRIPSMLPFEQYAEVLAGALDATRPISEVLAAAEAKGVAALPAAELNLLAFHAYDQNEALGLARARRQALFGRFWRETPAERPAERSRFLALALAALAEDADGEEPPAPLPETERAELEAGLRVLLADPTLRNTSLELVLYRAAGVVERMAPAPGAARRELVAAWNASARAVESDESLPVNERLTALLPQIALETLDLARDAAGGPPPVSLALQERVRARIRWASALPHDEEEMQYLMDTMAGLLEEAGLAGEAQQLLTDKLAETTAPYYYTGWLAGLEARAGRKPEAVALYREAWQGARERSSGAAMTSFRWGSTYLRQATKLTPEAHAAIAADAATILDDLLASPDAFAHGNWSRLQTVATALEQWRGEDAARAQVVETVKSRVHAACGRFPAEGEDSPAARCRSFLAADAA